LGTAEGPFPIRNLAWRGKKLGVGCGDWRVAGRVKRWCFSGMRMVKDF
jgi:hypothetical protein